MAEGEQRTHTHTHTSLLFLDRCYLLSSQPSVFSRMNYCRSYTSLYSCPGPPPLFLCSYWLLPTKHACCFVWGKVSRCSHLSSLPLRLRETNRLQQVTTGCHVAPAMGSETEVTYFFCGEEIPYRSMMKTHSLTLGHFKEQLSKKGNYR